MPGAEGSRRWTGAAAATASVWAVCGVAMLATACSPDPTRPEETALANSVVEVSFVTLSRVPNVWMDALFRGDVVVDGAGCIRMDGPDAHTVIWPRGYRLAPDDADLRVLDGDGRIVGVLGGHFELGGGEVPVLHDGIPLTAADRERLERTCPGRYWIAAGG